MHPKQLLILLGLALASAVAGMAGTIVGTVKALPPPTPADGAGGGGSYESRRYKFVEKIDYDHLRDFVVYIDQAVPGAPALTPQTAAVTTQRDANFDPHVLAVPGA